MGQLQIASRTGRISSTTSVDEALSLLEKGYTLVAAASGHPSGHLAAARPGAEGSSVRLSNIGREVGVMDIEDVFAGLTDVHFYYDPSQDLSTIDRSQVLNTWSY